jgi:hypothetical protein
MQCITYGLIKPRGRQGQFQISPITCFFFADHDSYYVTISSYKFSQIITQILRILTFIPSHTDTRMCQFFYEIQPQLILKLGPNPQAEHPCSPRSFPIQKIHATCSLTLYNEPRRTRGARAESFRRRTRRTHGRR